jgi:hypothetical protein
MLSRNFTQDLDYQVSKLIFNLLNDKITRHTWRELKMSCFSCCYSFFCGGNSVPSKTPPAKSNRVAPAPQSAVAAVAVSAIALSGFSQPTAQQKKYLAPAPTKSSTATPSPPHRVSTSVAWKLALAHRFGEKR